MSSAPAASIGPYRVVRTIGSGGWATVYEVIAPDGGHLALKRLTSDVGPAAVARFGREVESLRRIDHPGVLRLVDAGVDLGAPYLVTPLVAGTSLRVLLERGPAGVEGTIAVVVAAAEAVAAIHAGGLVHRDLKPEHVLVVPTGDVVVIDLGLALGPEHSRHTAEDTLTGSVPYMSPEQIEDRAPSPASDVWALGVVLYEAIAGRRPFARARHSEEVAAILAGRFAPLDEIAAACPPELARLVAACLAAPPAQRPRDAAALAAELLSLVDWTAPAGLAAERARLVTDPAGYAAAICEVRVELARAAAERALASGDRFAATRAVERGLAYAPDAPVLRALVERLMTAPSAAVVGRQTVRGHAPPPAPRTVGSRPPGGPGHAGDPSTPFVLSCSPAAPAIAGQRTASRNISLLRRPFVRSEPRSGGSKDALRATRAPRGRWLWALGAVAVVSITIGVIVAASTGAPAPRPYQGSDEPAAAAAAAAADTPTVDVEAPDLPGQPEQIEESRPARVLATRPAHVAPSKPARWR